MSPHATDTSIQIKDARQRDFYIAQRDLVRMAGRVIGVYGIAVYNALLCHADEDRECWPGLATIAEELGTTKPTVILAIEQLVKTNMINVVKAKGKSNVYRLVDAKLWSFPQPVKELYRSETEPVKDVYRSDGQPVKQLYQSGDQTGKAALPEVYKESKNKRSLSSDRFSENVEKSKNKPIGGMIDYAKEISDKLSVFDDQTQTTVKIFLQTVADWNKTGDMSQGRYLNLLGQLRDISATVTGEDFKAALQKAIDKRAHTLNYVTAILKDKQGKRSDPLPFTPNTEKKPAPVHYEHSKSGDWYCVEGTERKRIAEADVPEYALRRDRGDRAPIGDTPTAPLIAGLAMKFNTKPTKEAAHA